jgi:hypothetical protein
MKSQEYVQEMFVIIHFENYYHPVCFPKRWKSRYRRNNSVRYSAWVRNMVSYTEGVKQITGSRIENVT